MGIRIIAVMLALLIAGAANSQTTFLSFSSDDFVVTPVFNNVAQFRFDIEIDAPLAAGVYTNPDIVNVDYAVSGSLMNTPSGFPSFALQRVISGADFYAQGSSLGFEIRGDAVLADGIQAAELAGANIVFTFNGRENGNGRFHPALLELRADGTGRMQNSDNIISNVPFQQVDFGEEYITDLAFDPGNLTILTTDAPPPPARSGGGTMSTLVLAFAFLLLLGWHRQTRKGRRNHV